MSPRTGRPPKENPKNTRIQIRLDKEDIKMLDKCVEMDKSSRSEVIRKGIHRIYSENELSDK